MFRKYVKRSHFVRLKDSDGNLALVRPIDQFNAKPFNYGANGLPASDITLLARATSQKEFELVLSRLREIRVSQPDNSKKSDRQIALEIMPSWVQTPSEVSNFIDYMKAVSPNAVSTSSIKDVKDVETEVEKSVEQNSVES